MNTQSRAFSRTILYSVGIHRSSYSLIETQIETEIETEIEREIETEIETEDITVSGPVH